MRFLFLFRLPAFFTSTAVLWFTATLMMATPSHGQGIPTIDFDCDPCIERADIVVKVITHGAQDDPFWQLMQVPIRQVAESMRVTLDFDLSPQVDLEQMAVDIRAVTSLNPRARPDVLLVTVPSPAVEEAVRQAVNAGVPVFGMNAGYDRAADLGLLAFVGMDEYAAGVAAGQEFQRLAQQRGTELRRVLFVNHEIGNVAIEQRRKGLEQGLMAVPQEENVEDGAEASTALSNTTVATPLEDSQVIVDELVVQNNDPDTLQNMYDILEGCTYQGIMISSGQLDIVLEARSVKCRSQRVPLGSFDTTTRLYQAIAAGLVDFSVSQQPWLQGAMATAMAALYASTGMRLQLSTETEFGTYLSGPHIVTIENVPTDNLQTCETEGFPLCSSSSVLETGLTGNGCLCFDSSKVRLAAVTHGINTVPFWWRPRDAARQAALDMNVNIEFDLFPPGDEAEALHTKMASKMVSYCQSGVDGLIVSIPSDLVLLALEQCQALNVPIISINAGGERSRQLGLLHHVAQDEYDAGYAAGLKLVEKGATRGICLNQVPELDFLVDRCDGYRDALADTLGIDAYVGMVGVVEDNTAITVSRAVQAVEDAGVGWDDLGILVAGNVILPALLTLLDDHPEAIGGTFDTGPLVSTALGERRIVFGIDQQSYLQGYVPVLLLAWYAQTRQALANRNIASGPGLVLAEPTTAQLQCEETNFAICIPPVVIDMNHLSGVRTIGYTLGGIIMISALSVALIVGIFRSTRIVKKAQPLFLIMVDIGAALMGSTIFVLGVDEEIASTNGCSVACMVAPWLFTVGFTIVFAALYSKLRRLNKLIQTMSRFRRVEVTMADVITPFAVLISINIFLLTIWTVADPMYWKRTQESETESYGVCRLGDDGISIIMAVSIFGVNVVALILAMLEAYKARKVSFDLSGSGSVGLVVVSILQAAVVGFPILPLVRDDPSAAFLLKSGLVFVMSMSTLGFIFTPLLWRGWKRRNHEPTVLSTRMETNDARGRPVTVESEDTASQVREAAPARPATSASGELGTSDSSGSNDLPRRREGETVGEFARRTRKYNYGRTRTKSSDSLASRKSKDSWLEVGMNTSVASEVLMDEIPEETSETGENAKPLDSETDGLKLKASGGAGEMRQAEQAIKSNVATADKDEPSPGAAETKLEGMVEQLAHFVRSSGIERQQIMDIFLKHGLPSDGATAEHVAGMSTASPKSSQPLQEGIHDDDYPAEKKEENDLV